jgi:hypothetical protein
LESPAKKQVADVQGISAMDIAAWCSKPEFLVKIDRLLKGLKDLG